MNEIYQVLSLMETHNLILFSITCLALIACLVWVIWDAAHLDNIKPFKEEDGL